MKINEVGSPTLCSTVGTTGKVSMKDLKWCKRNKSLLTQASGSGEGNHNCKEVVVHK